jgi:hypothetical protein
MSSLDEVGSENPIGESYADFIRNELAHFIGRELTPRLIDNIANTMNTHVIDFVGVTEAAELLGVSKQRVCQMRDEGKLPPIAGVIRGSKFWLWTQIDEFASTFTPQTKR